MDKKEIKFMKNAGYWGEISKFITENGLGCCYNMDRSSYTLHDSNLTVNYSDYLVIFGDVVKVLTEEEFNNIVYKGIFNNES